MAIVMKILGNVTRRGEFLIGQMGGVAVQFESSAVCRRAAVDKDAALFYACCVT